jgi:hypothetical protein
MSQKIQTWGQKTHLWPQAHNRHALREEILKSAIFRTLPACEFNLNSQAFI